MIAVRKTVLLSSLLALSLACGACTELKERGQDASQAAAAIRREVGTEASVGFQVFHGTGGRRLIVNVKLANTPPGDAQQLKAKITEIVQKSFREHVDQVNIAL